MKESAFDRWLTREPSPTPIDGTDVCFCGSKYWDGNRCHSCGDKFTGEEE